MKYSILMFQSTSSEVKGECLDIFCDVLHRFGNLMVMEHEKLLNSMLVQLNSSQASLRKRAIQCLGKSMPHASFVHLMHISHIQFVVIGHLLPCIFVCMH